MSQNDFVIADDTGENVLTDINSALQALASNSRADNSPTTTYPSQFFANQTTGFLSYRDGSTASTYYNLAKLTGGLNVDQPSDFNGDVVFNGTHSSGAFKITFDADNTGGFGALIFNDFTRLSIGTGQDMVITHVIGVNALTSNTDSPILIQTKKGTTYSYNFRIETNKSDGSGNDVAYEAIQDGGQKLYFDGGNTPKLATTANGIEVAGSILPTTDNDKPLGSSSKRFSTLHSGALNTGDINMSNLNDSGNEIDGSQGSWSIQEGADDLFLINRVSGKKYKFNLTEVT